MSKITFRADEDLIERLEALDASKSEAMREALRRFLDRAEREERRGASTNAASAPADPVDDALAARVDRLIEERLDGVGTADARDLTVTVSLDDAAVASRAPASRKTHEESAGASRDVDADGRDDRKTCGQCGEGMHDDHVYCPNCGEKASRRAFCECGDEVRSDWSFCPGCGRRTPAADVLDRA